MDRTAPTVALGIAGIALIVATNVARMKFDDDHWWMLLGYAVGIAAIVVSGRWLSKRDRTEHSS